MISKKIDRYKSGVYKITNLVNNKIYIGSSINVYNRKHTHMTKLRNKTHSNQHLLNAYFKYGFDNFLFEVIEYCENYTEREQYYIDLYKPNYNIRIIAQNNKGILVSQETRDKIRMTLIKRYKNGLKAYSQIHKQKEVEQYDLNGILINTFKSPKETEICLNLREGEVSKGCNKKEGFITKGFQWKYKNSDKKILDLNKSSELLENPEEDNQQPSTNLND